MRRRQPRIQSKHVPYISSAVPEDAIPYLPLSDQAELTFEQVAHFVKSTRGRPEVRLAVLTILRTHTANGAEAPLSAMALLFAGIALLFVGFQNLPILATIMGLLVVAGAVSVVRMSLAAHARRLVAAAWLAAYEDGLAGKYGRLR